jgi:hypothetical protein
MSLPPYYFVDMSETTLNEIRLPVQIPPETLWPLLSPPLAGEDKGEGEIHKMMSIGIHLHPHPRPPPSRGRGIQGFREASQRGIVARFIAVL